MSFALPSAFWLAACAAPIILFYILKVRLRRQHVSTNLFWKQIYEEKPPRSIWQYLRHLLSLLVQLLILTLLVLAVADPYLPWQLLQARRLVVVVDRSASMRAPDVLPSRFGAAIESAAAVVDGLRFRDQLAIIAAGPRPEVVIGMSSHAPTLKRALRRIEVSDNPTDLSSAIDLAKRLISEQPHGEVLVYTDNCTDVEKGVGSQTPGTKDPTVTAEKKTPAVKLCTFGTRVNNVGITQFQARRSLVDPLGYEVLAAVTNASDAAVECRLELELNGAPVDVIPLKLAANEKWRRALQKTSIEGGALVARLTRIASPAAEDSRSNDDKGAPPSVPQTTSLNHLATDDAAWAIVAPRRPQNVLVVTDGNLFIQKVFQANPLVKCEVRKDLPKEWPSDAIIVLHRLVSPQLPPGNVLVVDPTSDCDAWSVGEEIENPLIAQQQSDSPLMAHLRLDNIVLPAARRLSFKTPPQALAGTLSGDPVYAEVKRERGKCLVLSVDLDRSDLAFRTAFPILATNALNWFRDNTGEMEHALSTGQVAQIPLPTEATNFSKELLLRAPSGRETKLLRGDARQEKPPEKAASAQAATPSKPAPPSKPLDISIGPLEECGVWTVLASSAGDKPSVVREVAVNLANERESDLRPIETSNSSAVQTASVGSWLARPLWFYLAAAACLAAVVEWLLHQRRVLT
jgi:hypothetical protein